ncbi:MAG TPA: MBL fold metallo-hydrolase [Ilumatobacter sp.]|jgi:ribonuclease BN (tRNA processing enzyme)|nr:MBL fold metallo-hydrolase [Ilumatobacter sp.]
MARDRHDWVHELVQRRAPRRVESAARLVLLGTAGGSAARSTRCGYANALIVDDVAYLVDCGEGVHTQLHRAGLVATRRFGASGERPVIETIFVTHLHADHIMDLVNVFQGSWPSSRIDVYGPGPAGPPFTTHDDPVHPVRFPEDPAPGIKGVIDHLSRAFGMNINARIMAEQRTDYLDHLVVHEIGLKGELEPDGNSIELPIAIERNDAQFDMPDVEPFVVRPEDEHGVTVTATLVQHAPVFPALAYRFDTPQGSVVFSGDTGSCDNVVTLAQGADILVHEVIDLDALLARISVLSNFETVRAQLGRSHTPVDEVGHIAARAGVRTLVLSHLVPGEGKHTPEEWEAMVRDAAPEFEGEIVCGVDLDEFSLSG